MSAETDNFIAEALSDPQQPVVVFSLEWCEFCWSARKLFKQLEIPYRSIDLDSVEYQQDQRGQKIRAALAVKTSVKTIPQIFVGGEFVGGCTDLFDAWNDGRLQALLDSNEVIYAKQMTVEPYSFLPDWLHPR